MQSLKVYERLFEYLSDIYFKLKIDDLGLLLGNMRMLEDNKSADPAIHKDWEKICGSDILNDALLYEKCTEFLKQYSERINSKELMALISSLENEKEKFVAFIIFK